MTIVALSSKFQITIPKKIILNMNLKSGMKFEVVQYGNIIELIPVKPLKKLRGSLKGMDTTITNEQEREL